MTKFQKFCALFFIVCVIACGGTPTTNQPSTSPAASQAPSAVEAIKITAVQLSRDYEENEVAADQKYDGKLLAVSGKISSINVILGQTSIVLLGVDDLSRTVTGFFGDDQKDAIAKLKKGQTISMEGRCDGKMLGVNLKDCKLK